MEAKGKRLYSGITLGAVLIMAFVLVQPTLQQANAVGIEGLPAYDFCIFVDGFLKTQPEDPISMNTVRSGNIVKTIHTEKEVFDCFMNQGDFHVWVDVTTYIEIYENIDTREVIETNAVATTCIKDLEFGTATVIDCESYVIPSTPVPVGSECEETDYITHPQEMNTVTKGKIAKTIEAQKEVFLCELDELELVVKKVEVILFTDIYEDLSTQEVVEVQFHAMRCVALFTDHSDDFIDATVETCQFSSIEN